MISTPPIIKQRDVPCHQCICIAACKQKTFPQIVRSCILAKQYYFNEKNNNVDHYYRYVAMNSILAGQDIDDP